MFGYLFAWSNNMEYSTSCIYGDCETETALLSKQVSLALCRIASFSMGILIIINNHPSRYSVHAVICSDMHHTFHSILLAPDMMHDTYMEYLLPPLGFRGPPRPTYPYVPTEAKSKKRSDDHTCRSEKAFSRCLRSQGIGYQNLYSRHFM